MIITQEYKDPYGENSINKNINMTIIDVISHVLSWNRIIIWGQCPVCSSDDNKIDNCDFCNYNDNGYNILNRSDVWNLWKYKKYKKK